ncbi:MAG: ABC transporter permease [Rhodothermales bacterium]|nr:ABC transporter permease [Rhodothermales bacterium]
MISGISVAGVTLGVAALIVVLSVMNGFYDIVRDLLVSLDPHVRIVAAGERGLAGADSLAALALEIEHVEHAAPYVEGKALLLHGGDGAANKVVIVRGVEPEQFQGVSAVVTQTGFGTFDLERRDGLPGVVLGLSLGQRLALVPGTGTGSAVALLSAPGIERMLTQVFGAPPMARFEVRGLYQLEDTYDESHVFVGLDEARRLFRMDGTVSGIELRLDDLDRADAVKAALQRRLDPARFEVHTWYDLQRSLYDVMRLEKWGASAILILISVVAAFNIVGSLTMVVIQKRRDVGVLQAMGVSRRDVRRIFLLEGVLIGAVGTGLGFAIGLTLALLQKHYGLVPLLGAESFLIDAYPVAIRAFDLVLIGAVSFGLCVLAAWYPATRAAAIEPAHAVQMDR